MGEGYTKLFSDIVDSSIWSEDSDTCKVWVTLLALSNADGFVRGSIPWLASKAKVHVDICGQALTKFENPDPLSRTTDNEGRRIQSVDRGWIILNHGIFRERTGVSGDPRKAYKREWMRKKRLSDTCPQSPPKSTLSTPASASVQGTERKKEKSVEKPESTEHDAFIQGWSENFKAAFGVAYQFGGGRDGKAVKSLLGMSILRIDLLEIAKKAWPRDSFYCKQSITIHGFADNFNYIQNEISKPEKKPAYRSTITGNY